MPERLTAPDANFLLIEQPSVHMHVAGLSILDPSTRPDGVLGYEDVVDLIRARIHLVPRFRQKVVFVPFNAGRPVWVDDANFDLDFHVRRAALPAPGGRRELADYVQRVCSRPLDRSKPLWEMYVIEGLEDGHVAILSKSHHAMIDGMSGIDIATALFDFTPEPRYVEPEGEWHPAPEPSQRDLLVEALTEQVTHPVRVALQNAAMLVQTPQIALGKVGDLIGGIASILGAGAPPKSPYNVPVGPNRRFAMAEVPVADAKLIKNSLGGTVNDVVLAAVAGSLNRSLLARGLSTSGLALRAMIPVSTRDESHRMAMGNRVSSIFVDLPIGAPDAATRLRKITTATKDLKSSHQAVAAGALMGIGAWAPPTLHGLAARLVARQRFVNLVISNVPGPQVPLYLAGARMLVTYPVMPLGETTALSVAVTSLSGVMGFGFTGDWDAVPDVERLAEGLVASFEDLKKAAGA
ncbi:MAG: wax ester/triacylglycerol synthase family O-acyltransferase [Actinomycetota bacterium]|nr:wax ester/triacylglycerol synthase family O-acyltransferase [Actinomycetota bacterium]